MSAQCMHPVAGGYMPLVGTLAERHPSLWVVGERGGEFPALEGDRRCDVVVVGAGITGLTLARLLVDAGVDVVVIDAGPVCAGATGYTTAKVTALHRLVYRELADRHGDERARAYAGANQDAVERIAAFVAEDSIECDLVRAPAVTYTEQDENVPRIEAEAEVAVRLGLPIELTTTTSLPYPVKAAIRLDGQLHFHPRRYCLGLAREVVARGGAVYEHTRALKVATRPSGVVVSTDSVAITADRVALATHLPFVDRGGFFARAHPHRSYALSARLRGDVPQAMYISVEEPTRSVRPAPGSRIIVSGEGHKTGHDPDTRRRYAALEDWATRVFEVEAIEHRWSAQDYQTVDGLPYVGRLTARDERILVATGFRKWGMTNGTAAAQIIADAVLERENPWATAFDATRLAPRASIVDFVRDNLDVARRFVGDRLAELRTPSADTLARGMGGIVKRGAARVAAYRDPDGALHAVSSTCTHLGCHVTFNTAEQTWDCPCHGSRFDVDGRVIEGPAVKDLGTRESPAG
ncbi:MAG: FAD-dependent oxidoreductase [Acidimicrobiia bacterium]